MSALTLELRPAIISYRLQNVYNILDQDRIFLLKFLKPDSKKNLVVDYGSKIYLSEYDRRLEPQPLNFVTKLRKHIKSKRLTNLKQIGRDRIIVLEFSNGLYYLVFEFFGAGNIILLDSKMEILALQRVVNEKLDSNVDRYAVREKYSLFDPNTLFADSVKFKEEEEEEPSEGKKVVETIEKPVPVHASEELLSWVSADAEKASAKAEQAEPLSSFHKKKPKGPGYTSIVKLLFLNCPHLSQDLLDRNLKLAGISVGGPASELAADELKLNSVLQVLNSTEKEVHDILSNPITGWIVLKKNPLHDVSDVPIQSALLGDEALNTEYTYEQFHAFKPQVDDEELKSGKLKLISVQGYNKTLDTFFSAIDLLKNALRLQKSKNMLDKKLNNVKRENDAKIAKLSSLEAVNYRKAELIIFNADKIEECTEAIQHAMNQGIDWGHIETLVKSAQQSGSESFADMIVLPLNLKENKIRVRLVDQEEEIEPEAEKNEYDLDLSDSEPEEEVKPKKAVKYVTVDIDLGMSAFANLETYFSQKKSAQLKKEKTEKTAESALKNSERKINATFKKDLEKTSKNLSIRRSRQKCWFEKFYWFVSNEGYLIIAPKDNLQLEMIYYKYFNSTTDYYVTSDVEGSLQVFVKNPYVRQEVPPLTLIQAGIFALSLSKAWNQKILTSAWYCEGSYVTKKDINDGSLLPDGVLNVTTEKRFLPPSQLSFGVGLFWLLDEHGTKLAEKKRKEREEELGWKVVEEIADIKDVVKERIEKLKDAKAEEVEEPLVAAPENSEEATLEDENDVKSMNGEQGLEPENKLNTGKQKKPTRGKKSKLKKSKKYADQDEEDRLMKLKALGVLKQIESQNEKEKEKERETGKSQNKHRISAPRQQKKYNEQFLDLLQEELISADYLSILDTFSPKINSLVKEKVVDVIPVFAPWQALGKFKYKAKIQPGSGKIGKSMNEVLNYFMSRKSNKESFALKSVAQGEDTKDIDKTFDFDLDFEFEHQIIGQLKPLDLQPAFTVKGVRVVLPSNAKNGVKSNSKGGKNGSKGKKK